MHKFFGLIHKTPKQRRQSILDPLDPESTIEFSRHTLGTKWVWNDRWYGLWGEYTHNWQYPAALVLLAWNTLKGTIRRALHLAEGVGPSQSFILR